MSEKGRKGFGREMAKNGLYGACAAASLARGADRGARELVNSATQLSATLFRLVLVINGARRSKTVCFFVVLSSQYDHFEPPRLARRHIWPIGTPINGWRAETGQSHLFTNLVCPSCIKNERKGAKTVF